MLSFPCPHCVANLSVPDEFAGKTEVCTQCHELVTVPVPAAAWDDSSGFADMTRDAEYTGAGSRRSEELWSSHGRDALFLAGLSLVLLPISCFLPVGVALAGCVALIATIMAIRALVISGSRSTKGLVFAIIALVLSLVPLGFFALFLLTLLVSFAGR